MPEQQHDHPDRHWFTHSEAADYLGVATRTIQRLTADGTLPAHRVKGMRTVRIARDDLDALMTPIEARGGR